MQHAKPEKKENGRPAQDVASYILYRTEYIHTVLTDSVPTVQTRTTKARQGRAGQGRAGHDKARLEETEGPEWTLTTCCRRRPTDKKRTCGKKIAECECG